MKSIWIAGILVGLMFGCKARPDSQLASKQNATNMTPFASFTILHFEAANQQEVVDVEIDQNRMVTIVHRQGATFQEFTLQPGYWQAHLMAGKILVTGSQNDYSFEAMIPLLATNGGQVEAQIHIPRQPSTVPLRVMTMELGRYRQDGQIFVDYAIDQSVPVDPATMEAFAGPLPGELVDQLRTGTLPAFVGVSEEPAPIEEEQASPAESSVQQNVVQVGGQAYCQCSTRRSKWKARRPFQFRRLFRRR